MMKALRFAAATVACAAAACVAFFALLALWGLAVAPFVRLRSSSFVIVSALALASAATIAGYRSLARRRARRARSAGPAAPGGQPREAREPR